MPHIPVWGSCLSSASAFLLPPSPPSSHSHLSSCQVMSCHVCRVVLCCVALCRVMPHCIMSHRVLPWMSLRFTQLIITPLTRTQFTLFPLIRQPLTLTPFVSCIRAAPAFRLPTYVFHPIYPLLFICIMLMTMSLNDMACVVEAERLGVQCLATADLGRCLCLRELPRVQLRGRQRDHDFVHLTQKLPVRRVGLLL